MLTAAVSTAAASSLKGWRDGPVSRLLTEDQYRKFGRLHTDAARRGFIDRFWSQFDDGSGVSVGFEETFERRCEAVNARFGSAAAEGWRTDRGRVYLSLGEPSSIHTEPGDANAIEKEVWTYGTGGQDPESGSALRITFFRCPDGDYSLDASCPVERDATSVAYDDRRSDYFRHIRDNMATTERVRILSMLAELLQPVPGGLDLSTRTVTLPVSTLSQAESAKPSAAPNLHTIDHASYFFRAVDGTVLTLLTLELLDPRGGDAGRTVRDASSFLGVATLEESNRHGEDPSGAFPQSFALDPFANAGSRIRPSFVGRAYLRPGRSYAMRFAVKDSSREEVFVRNALLSVPDVSRGFSASSIVPAEQFGPAAPDTEQFQVGSEQVVPKPGGRFRRSDLLRLYFQVYDAALDPVTAAARVDVVFRFYRTGDGIAKRYGKPFSVRGAAGASMGLALPIGDWPVGQYRVEVELHDRVAEKRTTAEGRFSIVAD